MKNIVQWPLPDSGKKDFIQPGLCSKTSQDWNTMQKIFLSGNRRRDNEKTKDKPPAPTDVDLEHMDVLKRYVVLMYQSSNFREHLRKFDNIK